MARAHRYPRLILAVVCLPVFIGALDRQSSPLSCLK
jgi:hypothetical protein